MSRPRPRIRSPARAALAAALLAAAAIGGAAAPARALTVGIADNKPDMFADPRFGAAGIRIARLSVGWDALSSPWQLAEIDAWLGAAQAANVEPLVSFGHSRTDRRSLPTPERFLFEFRPFRARYPWVRDFATWNEANHCGEPTCHRPQLVAAYYRSIQRECPQCTILGAELLDMPNMGSWVDAYEQHLGPHKAPRYWGLHNYIDANRLRTTGTRTLLKHASGQIWFTETGGIVRRRNRAKVGFPESAAHAAIATRWVFDKLVPLSRRITRVYLYHWNAVSGDNWDSGLISPTGKGRPALGVLRTEQRTLEARAARRRAAQARGGG